MSAQENPSYRFAQFELDPGERRLTGNGKTLALTPKVFDTLVLLVENAGHVTKKDALMKALWPRGFVDEATLSNHIWQIRRALGDTAKSTRFIETVPKVGYRFCAPVTRVAPADPETLRAATPPDAANVAEVVEPAPPTVQLHAQVVAGAGLPYRPIAWGGAILVLALTLLVSLSHRRIASRPAQTQAATAPPSIALVGFANLSQVAADAWLAPALTTMLGTEFGAIDALRVLPYESVQDATKSLAHPLAGGYSPDALHQIRRSLDADYVISGSYLIGTGREDPPLRVDITLQDLRAGTVAVVSKQSALSALNTAVEELGRSLREKMGIASPTPQALNAISRAQPPTPEVARHIGIAVDAMQRHDAAQARDELLEAIAQAPGFAPAYQYLSEAYTALGSRRKALAAAEQAAARAESLTPEQRLEIDAALQTARYDWKSAAATWQRLVDLRPAQVEYRIAYLDALLAVGEVDQAGAVADAMQRAAGGADPRITLAAARVADARNDAHASATLAGDALRRARERGLPALAADAEVELARARMYLGDLGPARDGLTAAIGGYQSIGNPRAESQARRTLARVLADLHQGAQARAEYQRAMALAQNIGDLGGVADVYRDMCSMLWIAGDRDAAEVAARHALDLSRDIGDLRLQAWTLRAIATLASDEASTDEILGEYREVTELTERSHDAGGHAWSLATTADALRTRGQLDDAAAQCTPALAEAAALTDPQFRVYAGVNCAQVAMDRGEIDKARALLDGAARDAERSDNAVYAGSSLMLLGQLDLEASHWPQARDRLERAIKYFASIEAHTGEAEAQALLAVGAQANGDLGLRDRSMSRATLLRAAITARLEVYDVDIAIAQLANDAAKRSAAIAHLREIAADAERRHWLSWALEAKLAAWRLMRPQGDGAAAGFGDDLRNSARQHGFRRIVALIDAAPRGAG